MTKRQKLIYTDKGNENNDADHSVGNGRSLNGRPDKGNKRTHILKYTRARDNVASGAASEPASFPDEPRQGIKHNSKRNECKKRCKIIGNRLNSGADRAEAAIQERRNLTQLLQDSLVISTSPHQVTFFTGAGNGNVIGLENELNRR